MNAVRITASIAIPLSEVTFTFERSPGPGGQNVNKLNTRAEMRFDLRQSPSLSPDQRQRLETRLGPRLTRGGVLIIRSSRFRTQRRNREDCLEKFADLLGAGLAPPRPRRGPTRPTRAAIARRLEAKKRQSRKKVLRQRPGPD